MTLTRKERKDLNEKGFIHLTYGTKCGWENMIGSYDDPVFDIIDKLKLKFGNEYGSIQERKYDKLWMDRLNSSVNQKLWNKFLKTNEYITYYLKKLKLESAYLQLKNKSFRIITDKEFSDTNWLMVAERFGTCMMGCGRHEQLLYFIQGDPGNIGSCKRCLFKNHRKEIQYSNGRKVDFRKELRA